MSAIQEAAANSSNGSGEVSNKMMIVVFMTVLIGGKI